jgi:hypothetical protein
MQRKEIYVRGAIEFIGIRLRRRIERPATYLSQRTVLFNRFGVGI